MTQTEFSALLSRGTVLLDGATGSYLMAHGMPRGVCTEAWVLEHPQVLGQLQREYLEAGTQILLAPTFSANRHSLSRYGLEKKTVEMNLALAELSLETARGRALVAGEMTTAGEPLEPKGTMTHDRLFDIYCEQAQALAQAGCDLIIIETMLGVQESAIALEAAKSVCALPILCSLTVQADGAAYFDGDCIEAVKTLGALGAAAVGLNCSAGPEQMLSLISRMARCARVPLLAKPNAGMPHISDTGEAIYPMTPEGFAAETAKLANAGAKLVGGCCGTTPAHIAALRAALCDANSRNRI